MMSRLRSFGYAFKGIAALVRTQPNARIHLAATLVVTALGLFLRISPGEWLAAALATGMVWTAEGFNTALEQLCDFASPLRDPRIGRIKDVCAAAVLLSAVAALAVGLIIFLPRLLPGS